MNISCQCHLRHPLALTRCSDVGRNDAEVDASADGSKARSTNGVAAGCRIGTDTSHRPNGGVGGRRYVPHSRRQSAVFRPSFRSVCPPPAMRIQWTPSTSGMQSRRRAAGTQQPGEKVLTIRSVRGGWPAGGHCRVRANSESAILWSRVRSVAPSTLAVATRIRSAGSR